MERKKRLEAFEKICDNVHNGNWSDATTIAVDNAIDVYGLLELKEQSVVPSEFNMISCTNIAILGMYIERLRYERIENERRITTK